MYVVVNCPENGKLAREPPPPRAKWIESKAAADDVIDASLSYSYAR
jgi:hypothetical protein